MIKYRLAVQALIPPISALYHIRVRYATFVHFKVLRLWTFIERTETDSECLMRRHLSVRSMRQVLYFVHHSVAALKYAIYLITNSLVTDDNETRLAVARGSPVHVYI